ncbi:MAG: DUF4340 domain-containing protein [Bdellovibrionales bacterium]|nr:DUF4340 domain-containing protein [Bdellovibrionales bacterium]
MTKRSVIVLGLGTLILAGIYVLTLPAGPKHGSDTEYLFSDVEPDRIAKIQIEQGEAAVTLELKDNTWSLPERNHYRADPGKIRSILLKLLDLSSTQRLPTSPEAEAKLGLDEAAIKKDRARVRFFDSSGKELAGLMLGNTRPRAEGGTSQMNIGTAGQYVRRTDRDGIYLIGLPVTVSAALSNWLDSALLNVLSPRIVSVVQEATPAEGGSEERFRLEREGETLALAGEVAEGKEIQAAMVSQVAAGLENITITDVHPAEEFAASHFDTRTVYNVNDGLQYAVETLERDGSVFARLRVKFDEALAEWLKAEAAAKKPDAAVAEPVPSPTADEQGAASPQETPTEAKAEKKESPSEPKLASGEEAEKLNAQFGPWVYELAEYQGKKFRRSREELLRDKDTPAPTDIEAAAETPAESL